MGRRKVHTSNKFDKDAASQARRGKDTAKLRAVIETPEIFRDAATWRLTSERNLW